MKAPLLYAAIPFALGIIAQRESVAILIAAAVVVILLRIAYRVPITLFLLLGFVAAAISENHNRIPYDTPVEVIVRIDKTPTVRGRWQRTEADVMSFRDSTGVWQSVKQRLQLYADTSVKVALGNTLWFNTKQYTTAPYLLSRGVTGRVYAYKVQWCETDTTMLERTALWSERLSHKIAHLNSTSENIALMQALTLGDKSGIDREQRHEYNRTGTAHMLAVSGLHVGIIFLVLSYLLGWIKLLRHGLTVYCAIVIILLWFYAALTGFSPSVLRAVVMFSLYQLGIIISRNTNNLNTLLGAGLILLVFNPNYLYDIGFQLSFTAMFGIVLFYGAISSLWHNWLWRLVAVSLAAQIAVLPLSCYYFGNIPLFGIVANLVLWLIVPTIIVLTLVYLLTGVEAIGELGAWIANIQNEFVAWGASHSWVAVEDVAMPFWVCLTIYTALLACVRILRRRKTLSPSH